MFSFNLRYQYPKNNSYTANNKLGLLFAHMFMELHLGKYFKTVQCQICGGSLGGLKVL